VDEKPNCGNFITKLGGKKKKKKKKKKKGT
jgi:hypothetical protein